MTRLCMYGALLLIFGGLQAPAAQTPVLQAELERADRALRRPDGVWVGRLSIADRAGSAFGGAGRRAYTLRLYQKGDRRRFDFASARRGLEARILYRDAGATVWFWDRARSRLIRVRDAERLRPVLQSAFYFEDLSGQALEIAYHGERPLEPYRPSAPNAQALSDGAPPAGARESFLRFTLRPNAVRVVSGARADGAAWRYGRLVLVVDPARGYRPLRKDLFNADRVMTRTLRYHYDSPVLVRSSGRARNPESVPSRLEMLDLAGTGISVIEFHEFDDVGELPDALFDPQNLNR